VAGQTAPETLKGQRLTLVAKLRPFASKKNALLGER
jgi:hypothetical protein